MIMYFNYCVMYIFVLEEKNEAVETISGFPASHVLRDAFMSVFHSLPSLKCSSQKQLRSLQLIRNERKDMHAHRAQPQIVHFRRAV